MAESEAKSEAPSTEWDPQSGRPPQISRLASEVDQEEKPSSLGKALAEFEAKVGGDEEAGGDDPGDETDAKPVKGGESEEPEGDGDGAEDDVSARLDSIRALLSGGSVESSKGESGAKPAADAASPKEVAAEAKAKGEEVADGLREILVEQFGQESGEKVAETIGKHVENAIRQSLTKFAGELRPFVEYSHKAMVGEQDRTLNEVLSDSIAETVKKVAVAADVYGRTASDATDEQKANRTKVRETALGIARVLASRGERIDDAKVFADAELLVRLEWSKKQGGQSRDAKQVPAKAAGRFGFRGTPSQVVKSGGDNTQKQARLRAALDKFSHIK